MVSKDQAFCTSVQLTLAGLRQKGVYGDREGGKRIVVEQSKGQKSHTEGHVVEQKQERDSRRARKIEEA